MEITLENKQYILKELELMNEDLKKCRSFQSSLVISKQIELFENELLKYRKPIFIEPPYGDNSVIYKIEYVDFTDEELQKEDFVRDYLIHMNDVLVKIRNRYKRNLKE